MIDTSQEVSFLLMGIKSSWFILINKVKSCKVMKALAR